MARAQEKRVHDRDEILDRECGGEEVRAKERRDEGERKEETEGFKKGERGILRSGGGRRGEKGGERGVKKGERGILSIGSKRPNSNLSLRV
jgi:hypothetical protein